MMVNATSHNFQMEQQPLMLPKGKRSRNHVHLRHDGLRLVRRVGAVRSRLWRHDGTNAASAASNCVPNTQGFSLQLSIYCTNLYSLLHYLCLLMLVNDYKYCMSCVCINIYKVFGFARRCCTSGPIGTACSQAAGFSLHTLHVSR